MEDSYFRKRTASCTALLVDVLESANCSGLSPTWFRGALVTFVAASNKKSGTMNGRAGFRVLGLSPPFYLGLPFGEMEHFSSPFWKESGKSADAKLPFAF